MSSRTRTLVATAAFGVAAAVVSVPSAAFAASPYYPANPIRSVTPSTADPNATVTLKVTGAGVNGPISVAGSGAALATTSSATADSNETASIQESVGASGSGVFTITTANGTATCTVTVSTGGAAAPQTEPSTEPAAPTPVPVNGGSTGGQTLPNTGGTNIFPMTVGGIALLATGAGLVAVTSRRRRLN